MFKPISALLNSFTPKQDQWKVKLFNNWDKVLGDLKDKVVILKAERHMLILGVTHPAWAQELFMLSDVLKSRINSLFENEQIKFIRFQTIKKSHVVLNDFKPNNLKKDRPQVKKVYTLNAKEYQRLSSIKDPELKTILKDFCFKCKEGNNE